MKNYSLQHGIQQECGISACNNMKKKKEIESLLITKKYEAVAFYSLNLAMKLDYYEYISRVVQLVISFD